MWRNYLRQGKNKSSKRISEPSTHTGQGIVCFHQLDWKNLWGIKENIHEDYVSVVGNN